MLIQSNDLCMHYLYEEKNCCYCQFSGLWQLTMLLISQLCQYCHEGPCKSSGHCCFPIYFHNVWLDRCPFPSWLNLEAIFTLGTLDMYALTSPSVLNSAIHILVNRWETIQTDALMRLELSLVPTWWWFSKNVKADRMKPLSWSKVDFSLVRYLCHSLTWFNFNPSMDKWSHAQ